jgi:hypothetical protein
MSKSAIGFPTVFDRPITVAGTPLVLIPERKRSSRIPSGVQGTKRGRPIASSPIFSG